MNGGTTSNGVASASSVEPNNTDFEKVLADLTHDSATSDALRAYLATVRHRDVVDVLNELETILPLFRAKLQQLTIAKK